MPYQEDQPLEEWFFPSQVDRITWSYNGLERGERFVENLDARTIEDLGDPIHACSIR